MRPRRGDLGRRRWISIAAQHGLQLVESGECDVAQAAERGMEWLGVEWEHGGWRISAGTARRAAAEWAAWTADTQRQIQEWLAARAARASQRVGAA